MKNKAFTLIELLGVIVLLGILSVVIIPKIGDSIQNSKETSYKTQENTIKKAVDDFLIDNTKLLETNDTITLKLGVLKQGGYLPITIKNPKTKKDLSNESLITITKNGNKYDIALALQDLENVTETIDTNSPILVLNGEYIEYVEVNTQYNELGALAYSSTGGEIPVSSPTIKKEGQTVTQINTNTLGTYNLIYEVTDNGKTTSATRTVIVRDSTPPTITIASDTSLHVSEVETFRREQGVTITDNYDTNPTLTINSTLANLPGNYIITYTVTDSSGNQTTERRVINVNDNVYGSHEITYQIKGKTTPSTTNTPTMDNPVTYYGLGQNGTINVTTTGKNLFDEESILMAIEGATTENGHYVINVDKAFAKYKNSIPTINFKENTQYTMTIKGYSVGSNPNTNNGFTNFRIVFKYTDGTETYRVLNSLTETELTYTSTANKTIEKMYMIYGYVGNAYISHIQLEEGTTATEYEPYKGRTTTIDMTGHDPLMCLGDNCDYMDYENKRIVRNVGKYTVTGNEDWELRNSDTENNVHTYSTPFVNYKYYNNTKAVCNYFNYPYTVPGYYHSSNINGQLQFTLYYNSTVANDRIIYVNAPISTQADFKSNLQSLYNNGNPMIIYYELAQPTYESITLPQLNKYYGDKSIIAHDEYGGVEVTY